MCVCVCVYGVCVSVQLEYSLTLPSRPRVYPKYNLSSTMHTHAQKCRHFNGKAMRPAYVGRKPSAATATGLGGKAHTVEQEAICSAAFTSTSHSSAF